MNTKELLSRLPSSWDEVTLKQFQTLTATPITEGEGLFNGIQNTIEVISKLTGESVDDLESLPMQDLISLGQRLSYMTELPKESKTSPIKWKKPDEITFNNYIRFTQIPADKQLESLHIFVKDFSHTTLTEEEVLELSVPDVLAGFFLSITESKKYLTRSIKSTATRLIKQRAKEKIQTFKQRIRK